jgi:hypothetical protein
MLKKRRTNQGLPEGEEVEVACYKLENIQKIALMDETLTVNDEGIIPALGA